MKNKKTLFFILIITALVVSFFVKFFVFESKQTKNLKNEKASLVIDSEDLLSYFIMDEKKYNDLYTDKIIEVTGYVEELNFLNNKKTIILKSSTSDFGIICELNKEEEYKIHQLKQNDKITVKGICKGFLKDVILLNCIIETNQDE